MDEPETKRDKLALDVLRLSRNTLLVNLRFLDMALSRLAYIPADCDSLMTDGERLIYNAAHVLQCYKAEKEIPVRDYLHIVLHCVYRHMFMNPTLDRALWDLSCDIAVENVISELGLRSAAAGRERQQAQELVKLKQELKLLTAEKIYAYFRGKNLSPPEAADLRGLFYADNHEIWYMTSEQAAGAFGLTPPAGASGGGQGDGESNSSDGGGSESDDSGGASARMALSNAWKDIAERMQTDIMMFSNGRYGDAGSIIQNLKEVNREKYDYTAFLKKFAVMGEAMKINDDEFDYIFYTYGLKLYDKMPLVEPLEYKEVKRIKDFVIAIDTSGSVIGDLVQSFVQKTYNILKSTESFFSKINLHIIQCDTEIQEDVTITNQVEFDRYIETMQLHGFGGNNEVRLFSYVDELIAKKQFTNLKGMIYFTDGYGIFPNRKPDYEVAFVFVDDRYEIPEVPAWVIKLVLQKDEI